MKDKIKIANELRKQSNQALREVEKVTCDWTRKVADAKTTGELRRVNKEYRDKYNKADKKESKAYAKYYGFVHKHWDEKTINESGGRGKFDQKSFINNLAKKPR